MQDEDEYDKAVKNLLAQQNKEQHDLILEEREKWGMFEAEKQAAIDRYGHTFYTSHTFRQKEENLIKEFNERRQQQAIDHEKALADLAEEPNNKSEAEKIEKKETANEEKTSPVLSENIKAPDPSQAYKDLLLDLKKERKRFFKEHYEEMASIARHPETPEHEIEAFMDRDDHYLKIMAISHYKQIFQHPDNPQFKAVLEQVQKEDRERQAEAERKRQQELERQREQQKIHDRFELARQQYEQNKSLTQKQKH